jgi:hypothetical protein
MTPGHRSRRGRSGLAFEAPSRLAAFHIPIVRFWLKPPHPVLPDGPLPDGARNGEAPPRHIGTEPADSSPRRGEVGRAKRRPGEGEATICGAAAILCAAVIASFASPALAAPIANPVATFSGLDKITARVTNFDVYVNETVQFGSLQITPRVCYTRPATETQQRTSVFVEVDQVNLKGGTDRIFTGWMFADSPALNAIDHPVYDIWLVDCKQTSDTPPPEKTNPAPDVPSSDVPAEPSEPASEASQPAQ